MSTVVLAVQTALFAIGLSCMPVRANPGIDEIDWEAFLAEQDMVWGSLNVQLSHSGVNQANRREMGTALSHRLEINRANLARNVDAAYRSDSYAIGRASSGWDLLGRAGQPGGRPPMDANIGRECGNLLWALHNVDLEYRYWQDTSLRDKVLYPIGVKLRPPTSSSRRRRRSEGYKQAPSLPPPSGGLTLFEKADE